MRTEPGAGLRPALLLVALLLGGGLLLAQIGPATSTETRYAEMGREMLESGDWLVPTLDGAPLLEKPPFVYWGVAAAFAVLGVGDLSARIPGLVAGLLTLLAAAVAARRAAPEGWTPAQRRGAGALAALALGTMPTFLGQVYTISTDIWLVLVTTVGGTACLESFRRQGRPGLGWVLLLHVATGVGMLVKGPLALALLGGASLAAALLRRDFRPLRPFVHPLGLLVFAALAVPWYVALDARIPGTLDAFVERRLFGGLASSAEFHARPPWIVWLPLLGTAPWLGALAGSVRTLRARGAWRHGPGLPVACLALAAPLLFTFSASRLWSYASPAFPWIAVLIALGRPTAPDAPGAPAASWTRGLRLATRLLALVAVVLAVLVVRKGTGLTPWVWVLVVGGAGGAFAAARAWRRDPGPSLVGAAALTAVGFVLACVGGVRRDPFVLPALKPLWTAIEERRLPGEELGAALTYTGDWGLLPWYSRSSVRYFGYPAGPMLVAPERFRPDLFLPQEALGPWFQAPERRWLLVRTREIERELGGLERWTLTQGGGYSVVTNRPLEPQGTR